MNTDSEKSEMIDDVREASVLPYNLQKFELEIKKIELSIRYKILEYYISVHGINADIETVNSLLSDYERSLVNKDNIDSACCTLNKSTILKKCEKANCNLISCIGGKFCSTHSKPKGTISKAIEVSLISIKVIIKFFFLFYCVECDLEKLSSYLGCEIQIPSIKRQTGLCGYVKKGNIICLTSIVDGNEHCKQHSKVVQNKSVKERLIKKSPILRREFEPSSESDSD